VNDSCRMSRPQATRHFRAQVHHFSHSQWAPPEPIAEGFTLEQLGDDVRKAVMLADGKDGDDDD
jgi:hypothetical protein